MFTRTGAAVAAISLVCAAPAAARPLADYPQAPPQKCSESVVGSGSAAVVPVAGDPTAYQKCGPAGPIGIKHCATGSVFDSSTGYCVAKDGSGTGATLTVDSVWQDGDNSDCTAACPPKPIKVKLNYAGSSVGMASVTVTNPTSPGISWGGSASALTADGDTHSVVITTNKLVPTAADWTLKPGTPVAVQGYLTDGKLSQDGDPSMAVATVSQTVTAISKPAGSSSSGSSGSGASGASS